VIYIYENQLNFKVNVEKVRYKKIKLLKLLYYNSVMGCLLVGSANIKMEKNCYAFGQEGLCGIITQID